LIEGSSGNACSGVCATALPLPLPLVLLGERVWPGHWSALLGLALVSQVFGQGCMIYALGRMSPLIVGIALLIALRRVNIELSLLTILIGHTVVAFPFFFMIARVALERLDPMLEEAAADLGASPWTAFRKITLPQVFPVLLGAAALAFMVSLDEFIVTFFLSGNETTLPLFIFSRLRTTLNPSINVVSTLLMAITLALFVFAFVMGIRAERRRARRAAALLDQVG